MNENLTPHFSKKILFISILFLLVSAAWYALAVFTQEGETYRAVAPELIFAESHDVQVKTVYNPEYRSASVGQELISRTQIQTGEHEFAEIVLEDNVIRLDENTELTLLENNFVELTAYMPSLPRLVFGLEKGSVWVNAFDNIEIRTPRSAAQFAHSIGIMTYSEPMNRLMVVTGSSDLVLYNENGKALTTFMVPLRNQVTYVDNQIVEAYSQLKVSKLKKELKLAPIAASVLEDGWVVRNTEVDSRLLAMKDDFIEYGWVYSLKDTYYSMREIFTFIPQAKKYLVLNHAETMLSYLLGGVQKSGDTNIAKNILTDFDILVQKASDNLLMKQMLTGNFFMIGTVGTDSPAYLVKEHLLKYILEEDGPKVLRSYLTDLRVNLSDFDLDTAKEVASDWMEHWNDSLIADNLQEFTNQTQMFHRIILSFSDRANAELLAIYDESGQKRLDLAEDTEETRFAITEERLEISSALIASYRYIAAKQYLKESYESLNIDELDTDLASRDIFLERAKLLAQRIEYAEDEMHGAAESIDETEFREYIQRKTRDELLSENLKSFLQVGTEPEEVEPPEVDDVISNFADAGIILIEDDVVPQEDFGFAFDIKSARLIDRAPDGSQITFSAVYDFTTNAVTDVIADGIPLKGHFELNDLVAILKQNGLGKEEKKAEESLMDISDLLADEKSDEAVRAQLIAQDLAKQLVLNELIEAGIQVGGMDKIEVLDQVSLSSFKITEAYIPNPDDVKNNIGIEFNYSSSSKKASNIALADGIAVSGNILLSELKDTILEDIYAEQKRKEAFDTFKKLIDEKNLVLKDANINIGEGDLVEFEDLRLPAIPLAVSGSYDLAIEKFTNFSNELYEATNTEPEIYFERLAGLFVIDLLGENGISVTENQIVMEYPFNTIEITGYKLDGNTFSFVLDIVGNRMKDVTVSETGTTVPSITFQEFTDIALELAEEEEEEIVEDVEEPEDVDEEETMPQEEDEEMAEESEENTRQSEIAEDLNQLVHLITAHPDIDNETPGENRSIYCLDESSADEENFHIFKIDDGEFPNTQKGLAEDVVTTLGAVSCVNSYMYIKGYNVAIVAVAAEEIGEGWIAIKDDLLTDGEMDWNKFSDFGSKGGTVYYSDQYSYNEVMGLDPEDILKYRLTFH